MTLHHGWSSSSCCQTWKNSRDYFQQGQGCFAFLDTVLSDDSWTPTEAFPLFSYHKKKRCNCLPRMHTRIARCADPHSAAERERRGACLPCLPRGSSVQWQPDGCSYFCSQGFPQANSNTCLQPRCHLHFKRATLTLPSLFFPWSEIKIYLADFSNFQSYSHVWHFNLLYG